MNDTEFGYHVDRIMEIVNSRRKKETALQKIEQVKEEIENKSTEKISKVKKWTFTNYDKVILVLLLIGFYLYCKALTTGFLGGDYGTNFKRITITKF